MTIIGILGAIGSGKSHAQLKYGLMYADKREKQIVANFALNIKEIYKYACLPNYIDNQFGEIRWELEKLGHIFSSSLGMVFGKKPKKYKVKNPLLPWIKKCIEEGKGINWIINPENLQALLIPEAVILLDEAGVFLNSREFAKTPKELLADLAMSRKDGCDLIWCAQFDEQIDRQMRYLTQYFWHCLGTTMWDKKMRRPRLIFKLCHVFDATTYVQWARNPKARSNGIKTRFAYAITTYSGMLTIADKQLFKCFDSFSRLDLNSKKSVNHISTLLQESLCQPICNLLSDREVLEYRKDEVKSKKDKTVEKVLKVLNEVEDDEIDEINEENEELEDLRKWETLGDEYGKDNDNNPILVSKGRKFF